MLTPIAYLWERNQTELLREMVEAGMESVLVKVAGAGCVAPTSSSSGCADHWCPDSAWSTWGSRSKEWKQLCFVW